ncbi:SAM-dependent methyltransferase [Brasilonema octagenarum UFV-E1]|uniref:SAM-dependent methyltransferase n=1 Tax=Brasilonema sennae CENA114 TaxID=415709 RepID=A0A856M8C1_9CYAN|nr:class I SAM-dependent methyltransferase [Brasilonema sennae]QDL06634.1 SAM-dependent methyltransferase [Brasilonema sennae CENA114]QDL13002.1 SAM-dependent methyltransferase [Brasilonema octagenarum UFV-E1]
MININNPEINVDELMQRIREDVAKRHGQVQPENPTSKSIISNSTATFNHIFYHIDALLRNAESRSITRTKWPDNFNKFPFNLSIIKNFQKIALKILSYIFKDQREVNFNLIRALKESVGLNRQLIEEIASLKAQMDERLNAVDTSIQGMDKRFSAVDTSIQGMDEHLGAVYNRVSEIDNNLDHVDSCMSHLQEYLETMNSRKQLINDHLKTVDAHINTVDEHLESVDTRLEAMNERLGAVNVRVQNLDERDLRNDNYLKNDLVQQKRLITMFLEEARRRLPEPFSQEQLETFAKEEQHSLDAFYVAFEDQFRGSREVILNKLKTYLPIIQEAKVGTPELPILDVGCGRGEWLELLRESGYKARGIDINRVMLEQCKEKGLEVIESDVIAYLQSLPDASLGAVSGFHIIEHLSFPILMKLIDETRRVLHSGGIAIFETPNPENIIVGACNFYSDPTHLHPLFPPTVKFFFEQLGFLDVKLLRLRENRLEDPLQLIEADNPIASHVNPLIELAKFNFYAPPDFAVIAKKAQ